jgi:hypothetical protein
VNFVFAIFLNATINLGFGYAATSSAIAVVLAESGLDRKNFIRKLIRGIPVKRNSYNEFVRWIANLEQFLFVGRNFRRDS